MLDCGDQSAICRQHRHKLAGFATEVAKADIDRAGEGCATMGCEPTADLKGDLEQDREGHVGLGTLFEIPGIGRDIVFGLGDSALFQFPGCGLEADDAIDKQVGRARQAG